MTPKGILLSLLFLIVFRGYSQEPNDCVNAIAICGDIDFAYTPTGPGADDFLSNPNPDCLTGDPVESQSVWLKLTIDTGGILAFTFTPNNGTDDYDWAVYDMNSSTCNSLGTPLRCSSTMFLASTGGATGLGNGTTDTSEGPGTGDGFLAPINASPGDEFLVFINNWSSSTSGFNLEFDGTATFNPPPTDAIPTGISIDIDTCDDDGTLDGFTNFDLSINTPIITGAQSGISVTYHTSIGNAQIGANDIPDITNFRNTIFRSQTVFARITNTGTDCFSIIEFELNVLDGIIFSAPDMIQCDDDNNSLWDFDLRLNDAAIINGVTDVQVVYFESELNANNNIDPILGLHENNGNPQEIWARLESTVGSCFGVDSFTIEVFDTPIATQPMDIILCDDDNNGTMPIDLTSQDTLINTATGMSISYHPTQLDADTGASSNSLSSPFETGTTTIYVRVENDENTNCYDTTSFEIEVYDSAFPLDTTSILPIEACDNTTVGSDTDGFIVFDLTEREMDILNGQDATEFTLTYFTDAGYSNQIPNSDLTNFTNTIQDGQTIYVRMINNLNTDCYTETSIELEVFEKPVVNSPSIYSQCDDSSNDGQALFNLTLDSIKEEISTDFLAENLMFTYFTDQDEAEINGVSISNPAAYQNPNPFVIERIWIRVENPNGCFRVVPIDIEVTPSSAELNIYNPISLYQCDDGSDLRDGIASFDLSSIQSHISNIIFSTITVSVDFYENQNDAELENNVILDIENHQNTNSPNQQDIWVRVKSDLGNNCLGLKNFPNLLIVEELPTANKPTDITECDDDGDGEFPFDISMVESEILGSQSLTDVTISYFNEDGTSIGTSLPNPFLTASQTIDIVVSNNSSNDPQGTCTDTTTLTFVVDISPRAVSVAIPPSCDDTPNDTDGISIFDTTTLENDILDGQTGMNVYYTDASGNPLTDSNGVVITSPFPGSFSTTSQTISVAVENPVNTTCIATATIDFIVLLTPEFDLEEETLVCENLLPYSISVENPNQSNYDYQWFNSLGVEIGTDQTLSIINTDDLTAEGVDYSVIVTNPITMCSKSKTILVKTSSLAAITEEDIITIEFNSPENTIEINTTNLGTGDYEFSLKHEYDFQPFQDEPIFTGLLGGIYTLVINDKNGCGETELTIILLDYPKFLTPNNDGHNDTWKLVGIDTRNFIVSPIQIFDRFGKIVAIIDPKGSGWDGYYNGTELPASDYWFRLQLTNSEGTTIDKKGHFSLVRR